MLSLKNRGLLLGKRETDYQLGSSPVVKEVLNPSLNWKEWSPEHEIQAKKYYDTLSCVTYSALDAIEYIFIYRLNKGQVSPQDVKWLQEKGYFQNGLINFSERFTAILGETTSQGAYQYKVGDAIRKFGLIPESMFNAPIEEVRSQAEFLDKTKITPEMYTLGLEFVKRFPINYEWALNLKEGLKYAPLQVCVYYADGDGLLCPTNPPIHAVLAINLGDDFIEIDDSYSRQYKKYCPQAIYSSMLYTVNFKTMTFKKEKGKPHVYFTNENTMTKVMIIDMDTLNALGGQYMEVDNLDNYSNAGTFVWVERKIE